ncbi:BC1872 family protein [Metabacillus fastidiosus]|uniref:BC1872 family protein n=1 Tax=Metabacillus fastidiosus TaxID=1458 RepID=UPI003D27626C
MNEKINKLIAEKVMGWKVKMAMDGVTEYYDNGSFCEGKWVEDIGICEKDNVDVFKPSEKIQDAWMAVEKLKLTVTPSFNGWRVFSANSSGSTRDVNWIGTTNNQEWVENENVCMAICLAALEYVGVSLK